MFQADFNLFLRSRGFSSVDFPMISVRLDERKRLFKNSVGAEDLALSMFVAAGYQGDRTRGISGYPVLLRDLSEPPHWFRSEQEEAEVVHQPPLIELLHNLGISRLIESFNEHNAPDHFWRHFTSSPEQELGECGLDKSAAMDVKGHMRENLERTLRLGLVLGDAMFWSVFEAIFPIDEFTPAAGAPDLLIWSADWWTFVEVKAPGDYLSNSQVCWLHEHEAMLNDRYVLLSLAFNEL